MYNEITLEKGLYNITGKSFTEALSELDRDDNYVGTELEGLDAFERQLKRFDIRVSGENSDRVEKFFATTQSAILFPEFVRRCIKAGMDQASVLPYISAAKTYTDGVRYYGISLNDAEPSAKTTAEGEALPITTVKTGSDAVAVSKYGRQIRTAYEVLRKQRLDLFSVVLKSVGAKVSGLINNAAAEVLKTGAESSETASTAIAYSDLAAFWAGIKDGSMSTMLVSPATMATILSLPEMSDCVGEASGVVTMPFGVKLVKCNGMEDNTVIGVDSTGALETVFGSDIIIDNEKLISNQLDNIAFSVSVGFAKIYPGAAAVLNVKSA